MIMNPAQFDIGSLTNKLDEHAIETDKEEKRKQDFEEKRKKHYANEFNMAQLLKNKHHDSDDEDEEEANWEHGIH